MSNIFFISDLHLGHGKMVGAEVTHRRSGSLNVDDHDKWIVDRWNSVVTKHDLVWVLGDICFDKSKMKLFKKMRGCKHLLLGNHDEYSLKLYLEYFNKIHGFMKYKGAAWLSHVPINPGQLRNKWNIHGHTHSHQLPDLRYICVTVEALKGVPISWEAIKEMMEDRRCLMKKSGTYLLPTE